MEILFESIIDAFKDTLYLAPFLYLTYVVMEWLETKTEAFSNQKIRSAGRLGPIIGSICGLFPQCGFSATAATLYSGRVITRGTLIAVFLATSDEMLPIFIAKTVPLNEILQLLFIKLAIGVVAGYTIDIILTVTNRKSTKNKIHQLCKQAHCECEKTSPHSNISSNNDATLKRKYLPIFKAAFTHTIKVIAFVFVITLAINFIISLIGEDTLRSIFKQNEYQMVIISAIFGLIPNCAASVAIADLWVDGVLCYAAMLSGLLSSAGVGILVLLHTNKEPKRNAVILITLVSISVICGFIAIALGA